MISLEQIEEVLEEFSVIERHEVKYAIRFYLPLLGQFIYINKQAGNEASGLVIHPRYESKWCELYDLVGVHSTETLNHKSSYREFPQRLNSGKEPIPFGIPFGFDSKNSMQLFLNKLIGIQSEYVRDPDAEINDAEGKGEFDGLAATEVKRLLKSRKGQGKFRRGVIELWKECCVTGCQKVSLLKASHIKPWRDASNLERLDPYNGLLLIPNIDTLFDGGLVTFGREGEVIISNAVEEGTLRAFGIETTFKLSSLGKETEKYLRYHRKYIFRK